MDLLKKQDEPPVIASSVPHGVFMIFIFLTGALIISFEIIFVRILNLSLGAGVYNFPMILSIFVGGLSLGSLSLRGQEILYGFSYKTASCHFGVFMFIVLFFPFLGHLAKSYKNQSCFCPGQFILFFISWFFCFCCFFLFPPVFFMGRLLPLVYGLLKKTKHNYGKICGQLYFINTLGTVFGAIVIGYLAFYLLNLDTVFKINIYILFLLTLSLLLYAKNKRRYPVFFQFVFLTVIGIFLIYLPKNWNRAGHEMGYFRTRVYRSDMHFQGLFVLPSLKGEGGLGKTSFFEDGPNTTVSLINFRNKINKDSLSDLRQLFSYNFTEISSYSIVVNGKSDGNFLGDFSTMFMMLPYLYSVPEENLKTVVIGLGTGISAGAYGRLKPVKSVDVLEISPFVAKAVLKAPPQLNFHVMNNPKVKTTITDAFKYFTKTDKKFDIILSEPSNPWVVGVENLFTLEFYKIVTQKLNTNGLFAPWLQTYEIDTQTLKIVLKTLAEVFPYTEVYYVGYEDILIVAGLQKFSSLSQNKFKSPFIKKFYKVMGVKTASDLYISRIMDADQFQKLSTVFQVELKAVKELYRTKRIDPLSFLQLSGFFYSPVNSLIRPQLIYRASVSMFLDYQANPFELMNDFYPSDAHKMTKKMKVFETHKVVNPKNWNKRCLPFNGFNFLCGLMNTYLTHWNIFQDESKRLSRRFNSYIFLRRQGLIPYDKQIMTLFFEKKLKRKNINFEQLYDFVFEKIRIQLYEEVNGDVLTLKQNGFISLDHYKNFQRDLKVARAIHSGLE